jgi:two-component system alkaline phosphatase synthesis response regulator PhoP
VGQTIRIDEDVPDTASTAAVVHRAPWPVARDEGRRRVLLVSPDHVLNATLRQLVEDRGYDLQVAKDGAGGREAISADAFDLIVLDGQQPEAGGLTLCRELRSRGDDTPLLLFTAPEVRDRVAGLRLGADDCVDASFETSEVMARVEALLRRRSVSRSAAASTYRVGDISLDVVKGELRKHGTRVDLSPKEYQLLRYLIERRGLTLSREELLNEVWGYEAMPSTRTVDVHVAWLRRKLELNPRCPQLIITVHGTGYKFAG